MGGYVAALMSKTKEIGWIGHMDTVNLARFRNGFIAGAQYAVPECKVAVGFTGDFYDPIKGQEATYAMHENNPNVDIIAPWPPTSPATACSPPAASWASLHRL